LSSTGAGLQWINASSIGGTNYTFTNGLTLSGSTVKLGGTLTENTQIGTSSFGFSFLGLGNTKALYIGSNGYVGIGTTIPTEKLEVVGNIALQNINGQLNGLGSNANGQLAFYTNAVGNSEVAMVIDDDTRNVGIGTTAPTAKLDIFGGTNQLRLTDTDYTNSSTTFDSNNNGLSIGISGIHSSNLSITNDVGTTFSVIII
jgi:hypothetical protein